MNPDIYLCALLNQLVKAREGDIRREFSAAASLIIKNRNYDEENALALIKGALDLETLMDQDQLLTECRKNLNEDQKREAVAMMAIVARADGHVSSEEEAVFSKILVGLGVQMVDGKVSFASA